VERVVSGYDVLLFVGATTLVAAIITLFLFQSTAAKFERRINRRSHTLEGPVPGHRSLSSIGLNTESARAAQGSSRPSTRQPAGYMEPPATNSMQELGPSTLTALLAPPLAGDTKLNSLQTIRARSAALHSDEQGEQSTGPKPPTPAGTPPVQRLPKRTVSEVEQEQGPATPHAKSRPEKARGADSTTTSSASIADAAEPTITPKATTSKRAKRASAQSERNATAQRGPEHASPDALADSASLDLLDALQASENGSSLSQDGGLPDIFAGLNEAEAGIQGLTDDLSDIDGGGLPAPAPKTPQKSRR
jgi:hypothetical protein